MGCGPWPGRELWVLYQLLTHHGNKHMGAALAPSDQGCIGRSPPLPSTAPSLCPATVPLTPSASLNGVCNRQ